MLKHPSRSAHAAALSGAAIALTGCQSYSPEPLDLPAHQAAWLARAPGDDSVRSFAERLAESGQVGGFDLADGLSLTEGEIVALVYNPDLRLARLRAGIAAATAEHAGRWQDPEFGLDFLALTESASNPFLITPGVSLTVPISGRLEAEKAHANAQLAAELTRVAEQEWLTRIELRRAWLRWSAATLKADQTELLLASIESLAASTAKLADAGEILRTEAALFTIERSSQRQALLHYRSEADETAHELRAILGLSPEAPLELTPTILAAPGPANLTPASAADRNPTLARLRDEYQAAEHALRREVREQYPDLTLGPLAEFDRGDSLLGFSLSLPIPVLNANKQGIAEAHAERELARAAFETAYERLAGSFEATSRKALALREQRTLIESDIVPLVDRQLADAQSLLQLGEGGSLVLLESLTRAAQTRAGLIDARLSEALANTRLAELAGPPAHTSSESTHPHTPGAAASARSSQR